jgi:methylated-DNA-[protein]-cysteine S-methyltransferase
MAEPLRLLVDRFDTPIGLLTLAADEQGRLRWVGWTDGAADGRLAGELGSAGRKRGFDLTSCEDPSGLTTALRAYFRGDLAALDRLPVLSEGTGFQQAVWAALREIPCGETRSYAALARRIGKPGAVRAVGLANGSNPLAVVVPCHRVIGSDGSLTGYGGGIERKRWLLAHERRAGATLELPFVSARAGR